MARKDGKWIKSERAGSVTVFLTRRSPYWQMYWIEGECAGRSGRLRPKERHKSTRETDLALARVMASRKNEDLYKQREFPDEQEKASHPRHPARRPGDRSPTSRGGSRPTLRPIGRGAWCPRK